MEDSIHSFSKCLFTSTIVESEANAAGCVIHICLNKIEKSLLSGTHILLGKRVKETDDKQENKFRQLGINVSSVKKTKQGGMTQRECYFSSAFMQLIHIDKEIESSK